jgi:MFS family permease
MGVEAGERADRAKRASRSVLGASQRVARAGAAATRGTGRVVHRFSSASGAGRTGLASLIELTGAGSIGDAFVTIALAGTLFFSASLNAARTHVALALLVTIAPYAVLAPLIGPLLDRVKQGNRYILMGTLLARGLLCWGMAGAGPVTLLPAAFGVLVLQKVYTVTKAAVTPRLLPREISLVSANARANLGGLIASSIGAVVAVGIDAMMGGGSGGAAWVLRVATFVYLAAMLLGLRLPDRVDPIGPTSAESAAAAAADGAAADGAAAYGAAADARQPGPQGTRPLPVRRKAFTIPKLGPKVPEAMRANAAIRAFYGFMITFLAFILRSQHIVAHHKVEVGYFGHISGKEALAALAVAIAVGGALGTGIGSALRARAPQLVIYTAFTLTTLLTIGCALIFSLWTVLLVVLVAAVGQTLVKVALDSILQREISDETRSSAFAFSETVHQLALVIGSLAGVLLSLTGSGFAGLSIGAICLALALCVLLLRRRRRILHSQLASTGPGG